MNPHKRKTVYRSV